MGSSTRLVLTNGLVDFSLLGLAFLLHPSFSLGYCACPRWDDLLGSVFLCADHDFKALRDPMLNADIAAQGRGGAVPVRTSLLFR